MKDDDSNKIPHDIHDHERFWIDKYEWLQSCGYCLRPRYKPDWKPSWKTHKEAVKFEEHAYYPSSCSAIMDATRTRDGKRVTLKRINQNIHPEEVRIGSYFMQDGIRDDPRNHCVPIYEVLFAPDCKNHVAILVMPSLRKFSNPAFDSVGEIIGFLHSVFEGVAFMHDHHIAHRDCMADNIMMDASLLYTDNYHPIYIERTFDLQHTAKHLTRTQAPPTYYLIDFGLSRQYASDEAEPMEDIIRGGDKTVPEHRTGAIGNVDGRCNPFPTDVYYLGNMVREEFLDKEKHGLDFLEPLVADMVLEDPAKRPTMAQVVERFEAAWRQLEPSKLWGRTESGVVSVYRQLTRRTTFEKAGLSPIPGMHII